MECPFCKSTITDEDQDDWYLVWPSVATASWNCPQCTCHFEGVFHREDLNHKWELDEDSINISIEPTIDELYYLGFPFETWGDYIQVGFGHGATKSYPIADYEALMERVRQADLLRQKYGTDKPSPDQLRHFWLGGGGG